MDKGKYNRLIALLSQVDELKDGFITQKGGPGSIDIRINNTEKFKEWKADVVLFLHDFKSEYSKDIINTIEGMKGWHDERDFEDVVAKLNAIKKKYAIRPEIIGNCNMENESKGERNMKKMQVFISSTYTDLLDEREAAVSAILDAGHIPAGMELFKAGKSQMETIKKWIDDSDIYMLILGGRYGSIDDETGKSYTHLEYNYAQKKGMPIFCIVINEKELIKREEEKGSDVIERDNKKKYDEFRKIVTDSQKKIIEFFDDTKDINIAIIRSLPYIVDGCTGGWVKSNYKYNEINQLESINKKLKEKNKELEEIVNNNKLNKDKLIFEKIGLVLDKDSIDKAKGNVLEQQIFNHNLQKFINICRLPDSKFLDYNIEKAKEELLFISKELNIKMNNRTNSEIEYSCNVSSEQHALIDKFIDKYSKFERIGKMKFSKNKL